MNNEDSNFTREGSAKNLFLKNHVTAGSLVHAVLLGRRVDGKSKMVKDILCFHNQKAEDGFQEPLGTSTTRLGRIRTLTGRGTKEGTREGKKHVDRYTLIFNGTENLTRIYSKDEQLAGKKIKVFLDYSPEILLCCLEDTKEQLEMVVFDNCFYSVSSRDKVLDTFMKEASRKGISTIFVADNPASLPPLVRYSCTLLILFKDNIYTNHRKIYEMFAKRVFSTFSDFYDTYGSIKEPFSCMVINLVTGQSFAGLQRSSSISSASSVKSLH
jgi:hypothetical protein